MLGQGVVISCCGITLNYSGSSAPKEMRARFSPNNRLPDWRTIADLTLVTIRGDFRLPVCPPWTARLRPRQNAGRRNNVGLLLCQRHRRCPNNTPTSVQCLALDESAITRYFRPFLVSSDANDAMITLLLGSMADWDKRVKSLGNQFFEEQCFDQIGRTKTAIRAVFI